MTKGQDGTPDSWPRSITWSPVVSRLSFASAVVALPLCLWIALAIVSSYASFPGRDLFERLADVDSALAERSLFTGFSLALAAVVGSRVAVWLRRGVPPAPRGAHWALVMGLLGLTAIALAVLGGWILLLFVWPGPA